MTPDAVRRLAPWAMAVSVLVLGLWGALSWSLIPAGVEGRIARVEHYSDTGYRFRVLELEDGRSLVVDRQIDAKLRALPDGKYPEGRTIQTDAWSRTLRTGDHTIDLGLSTAFWQVTVALGALCFLGLRPWRAAPADPV